ncbi:hypothetical protein [Mucilaginibacter sp.]|jgi:hypothetical protein|uniref:hypothetical protein n=1 Tax=Mucilaginibacter sp. TaxID=1882438 RepID=UPI003569664A
MENKQLKLSIFSSIFAVVLKPLIKAAKEHFKENALECVIEIITKLFDKDEEVTTNGVPIETPYQRCVREHSGQNGDCTSDGTWIPLT